MAARKPVAEASPLPTRRQWNEWNHHQQLLNPQFVAPDQLCVEDVQEWRDKAAQLAKIKASEMLLRQRVFKHFFPAPGEGTNNAQLPDGTKIVGKYPITRKVDEGKLAALKAWTVADMRAYLESLGVTTQGVPDETKVTDFLKISVDKLVEWDPKLSITEYRTLTAEQMTIFDSILEIKPGSFALDIILPKD
jgi:hypothetical protein